MKDPRWVWAWFALGVVVAAAALWRLGSMALALESAQTRLSRQAELEENVQLALWRMDSLLASFLAEEGARAYFTYSPFYAADKAYTHMFEPLDKGDVLVASPLLTSASPRVRLHFQFGPGGRLESPQVPEGNMRDLAEAQFIASERWEESARRLAELRTLVSRPAMVLACQMDEGPSTLLTDQFPPAPQASQSRGSKEYAMRSWNAQKAQSQARSIDKAADANEVAQQPMQAAWIGEALILGRRVRVSGAEYLQGCWLDWDSIRAELLGSVADLAPGSRLEPATETSLQSTRRLATLPLILIPPAMNDAANGPLTPTRLSLAIAWLGLAAAAGAVALLLAGALSLSERRGTFVSAVTHELRTPLTTFQLYSEMLSTDMVVDEGKRREYLQTLNCEAQRLRHLVKNVLLFARLERGRSIERKEAISVSELMKRVTPTLESKAAMGGMNVVLGETEADCRLRTDVSIVEQILLNLVDNATKYGNGGANKRIEIDSTRRGRHCRISVADHGPGLSKAAVRRLFRPFSKSAMDAAGSAPGVGLGLALSRRLARSIGGDLVLDRQKTSGATFALVLPLE